MRTIVFAAFVIAVVAILVSALFAALVEPRGCDGVDAEALEGEQAGQLIARGWFGDPEDGAERLYPPQCYPREDGGG